MPTEKFTTPRLMVLYGWESNPYAECTIRALLRKDLEIDFVTRDSIPWLIDHPRCTIHPLFPGHRKGRSHFGMVVREVRALARVLRLVLRKKPDIVHYQSYRMVRVDWMLFCLLRLLGKKIVFTVHDTHPLEASALDSLIFSSTARRSDRLLVHNNFSRKVIEQSWKVPPEKLRVIPHGGYDHYYSRQPGAAARRELDLSDEDFVLLTFGTVRTYKGLDYLLPAVADAVKLVPNLRLIIAGRAFNQKLAEHYEHLISRLDLQDHVRFYNRFIETAEVEQLFAAADLVVLPYIRIDQSGVLFLAYTFGRPVLATGVGGLPELVKEGISGFLIPPADSQAICAGIVRAWNERDRLPEMGTQARRLVEEEYTWERQADITVETYEDLLSEKL